MVLADWIAIGVVLVCLAIGALVGFGKWLKVFTSGIFGFIISVVVCALIGTTFLAASEPLLNAISSLWAGKEGWFFDMLDKIHIETVLYFIMLFIAVQLVRIIFVQIVKAICDSDNTLIKVINKTLGAILFLAVGVLIALLVFAIIGMMGGDAALKLSEGLQGSAFKLDLVFKNLTGFVAENMPVGAIG